jgi:Family of unknown function (DUF6221)
VSDLARFLEACIAEDEAAAKAARARVRRWHGLRAILFTEVSAHIERYSPARALREVEAKRKILTEYVAWTESYVTEMRQLRYAVACLAAVYSDRPGYDPEWAS